MSGRKSLRSVSGVALILLIGLAVWVQSQRDSAPQRPASPPSATATAPAPATATITDSNSYDLGRDEQRGGHTLSRHVGRTDDQLRERLRREPDISAASTYTDRATAERVVAATLAREQKRVDAWLAREGNRPNLALDYRGRTGEVIGRSIRRGGAPRPCEDAVVVLRVNRNDGFIVLTSYPEAR